MQVQEVLKGRRKLLQPLLLEFSAMKSIEGWRPHRVKHSWKQQRSAQRNHLPQG